MALNVSELSDSRSGRFVLQHRSPSHLLLPVPTPSNQHPPSAPLKPTLTPKQRLTEWVQDALSSRAIRWDRRVKTTTHLHLMSSLRRRGALPPLSHTPSYAQRQLYLICMCVTWILTPSEEYRNTNWLSVDKLDTQDGTTLRTPQLFNTLGTGLLNCLNARCRGLTFRHRASCIQGQAFRYSPENAFYIFNQQIYFII